MAGGLSHSTHEVLALLLSNWDMATAFVPPAARESEAGPDLGLRISQDIVGASPSSVARASLKPLEFPGPMGSLSDHVDGCHGGCGHAGSATRTNRTWKRNQGYATWPRKLQGSKNHEPQSPLRTGPPDLYPCLVAPPGPFSSPPPLPLFVGLTPSGWPCLPLGHSVQSGRTLSPLPARAWTWD